VHVSAVDFGLEFVGFARRTPDEERPHQFTFELNEDGSVQMNYKRFSFKTEVWNKKPAQLLSGVPDGDPPLQQPLVRHLEQIAESRAGVFKNFRFNTADGEFFSAEDIAWYTAFFNRFSQPDGSFIGADAVTAKMQAKLLKFKGLVEMSGDVADLIQLGSSSEPMMEPIIHANQTPAEKREIRAAFKAARRTEKPKLARGARALNAATQRVMDRLEQEANERLGRTKEFVKYTDELEIVGADATYDDSETMYLCHWTHERWKGRLTRTLP
jgi:hypothetical protein